MNHSNAMEPASRADLPRKLDEIGLWLSTASDAEAVEIRRAIADLIERATPDLVRRVDKVEYETVVAIGKLTIAMGDPEDMARIVTGYDLERPTESDPDFDRFRERYPRVDIDLVIGVRNGLCWLREATTALGLTKGLIDIAGPGGALRGLPGTPPCTKRGLADGPFDSDRGSSPLVPRARNELAHQATSSAGATPADVKGGEMWLKSMRSAPGGPRLGRVRTAGASALDRALGPSSGEDAGAPPRPQLGGPPVPAAQLSSTF